MDDFNPRNYIAPSWTPARPGFALPSALFSDERVYAADLEHIFARHWLFVASEAEIPEPGDYKAYQIGAYPIFILRQDDGSIAAFHNTCRHRGSRILQQASGVVGSKSSARTTDGVTISRARSWTVARAMMPSWHAV